MVHQRGRCEEEGIYCVIAIFINFFDFLFFCIFDFRKGKLRNAELAEIEGYGRGLVATRSLKVQCGNWRCGWALNDAWGAVRRVERDDCAADTAVTGAEH